VGGVGVGGGGGGGGGEKRPRGLMECKKGKKTHSRESFFGEEGKGIAKAHIVT